MRGSGKIQTFCIRHPLVGAALWISSVQLFLTQVVVALAWPVGYSTLHNTISDLGNTVCGTYAERYVCSPWHIWMNASFISLGITMLIGAMLLYFQIGRNVASMIGFWFMAIAGIGTSIVGLFPANISGTIHGFGAFMPFFFGNIALIILGLSLNMSSLFRFYSVFSGVITLIASLLFITGNYLGIGIGGMERLAVHPQTIWLIIFGYYVTKHVSHKSPRRSK